VLEVAEVPTQGVDQGLFRDEIFFPRPVSSFSPVVDVLPSPPSNKFIAPSFLRDSLPSRGDGAFLPSSISANHSQREVLLWVRGFLSVPLFVRTDPLFFLTRTLPR